MNGCLLSFSLIISLALFFGLFFGLNYPEIVRHGWPLASCTVLSSQVVSRYCCESNCDTSGCSNAPSGSPSCGPLIAQLDSGYSPTACALNSSACPPDIGSVCGGGSYCCSTCCSTCTSCTSSCSGGGGGGPNGGSSAPTCSSSCSTYSCNCYCCDSASNLYCTVSCPICYDVDLSLSYKTRSGQPEIANYTQDFGTNNNTASAFYTQHLVNSTSACHYDPHKLSQISYDVAFTVWKWVVSAIFGVLPLTIVLFLIILNWLILPVLRLVKAGYSDTAKSLKDWNENRITKKKTISPSELKEEDPSSNDDTPPPPYAS